MSNPTITRNESLWRIADDGRAEPVMVASAAPRSGDYALYRGILCRLYPYRYGPVVGASGRLAPQCAVETPAAVGRVLSHFAAASG